MLDLETVTPTPDGEQQIELGAGVRPPEICGRRAKCGEQLFDRETFPRRA